MYAHFHCSGDSLKLITVLRTVVNNDVTLDKEAYHITIF